MEWDPEYLAAIERRQCELIREALAHQQPPQRRRESDVVMLRRVVAGMDARKQKNGDTNTGHRAPVVSQTARITWADLQKKIAAMGGQAT